MGIASELAMSWQSTPAVRVRNPPTRPPWRSGAGAGARAATIIGVPALAPPLLVALAGFAAVVVTGLIIVAGGWAVRWLRLPNEPPEDLAFEPPAPEAASLR